VKVPEALESDYSGHPLSPRSGLSIEWFSAVQISLRFGKSLLILFDLGRLKRHCQILVAF
jgi:hypothetical protein